MKDGESWLFEVSLKYDTVLQVDRFWRKQEKRVQVPSVLLFISLRDIAALCLRVQIWCETYSSLLFSYFASVSEAPKWTGWESGQGSRRGCLSLSRLFRGSKRYMEGFTGRTLPYDLIWRDVVHVLGQILTPDSRAWVLAEATAFGDKWLECETRGNREHEIALLPQFISVAQSCPTLCDPMFHCLPSCSAGQTLQAVLKLFLPHQKNLFVYVQFSRSVVSDSLRPHELQHARPPCPSPTPAVRTPKYMFTHIIYINT